MAAPNIPDLNILRNARGAGCGRGRGSNGLSNAGSSEEERVAKDRIVQQTDQDASISRLSAVELGYLHDPFAKYFVSGASQRRFPIINRGTERESCLEVKGTNVHSAPQALMFAPRPSIIFSTSSCPLILPRGSRSFPSVRAPIHASSA